MSALQDMAEMPRIITLDAVCVDLAHSKPLQAIWLARHVLQVEQLRTILLMQQAQTPVLVVLIRS